jgi:hypothetical protein
MLRKRFDFWTFVPWFMGVGVFFIVVGPRVLRFTNIAWLGEGDPAAHYLGWAFFRNSPWTFPLGLNPAYGLQFSSSILFSDSNPLLAFIFKPFSSLLPYPFQYFGLWILACFMLQAWFGWKLTALLSKDRFVQVLCTGFFLFAPPMIWRLYGHFSLVGHFFILAALYGVFRPQFHNRILFWGALLFSVSLVHPYLLVMALILWISDGIGRLKNNEIIPAQLKKERWIIFFLLLLSFWQAGYFIPQTGLVACGWQSYRMTLLSFLMPQGSSSLLRDLFSDSFEGMVFLGTGIIFLCICFLTTFLSRFSEIKQQIKRFPYVFFSLGLLTFYALSNKIGVGDFSLTYPLPPLIVKILSIFRASGRMAWPAFYAIYFFVFWMVLRWSSLKVARFLLLVALTFQIVDFYPFVRREIRPRLMSKACSTWKTSLQDPFWEKASKYYAKVRWIPSEFCSPQWFQLASYAVLFGLQTDAVYLARVNKNSLYRSSKEEKDRLREGRYEEDSLYFFSDKAFQEVLLHYDESVDAVFQIDGFNVLAPGWKKKI